MNHQRADKGAGWGRARDAWTELVDGWERSSTEINKGAGCHVSRWMSKKLLMRVMSSSIIYHSGIAKKKKLLVNTLSNHSKVNGGG